MRKTNIISLLENASATNYRKIYTTLPYLYSVYRFNDFGVFVIDVNKTVKLLPYILDGRKLIATG